MSAPGTCYVLVPLPSLDRQKCSYQTVDYIQKEGCDAKGLLTKDNFDQLCDLGKSLLNRLQKKEGREVSPKLITFENREILSALKKNDVVYVTAHGMPNSIGNAKKGVDLPASKLAREFIKSSQSPRGNCDLGELKIMACNSGLNTNNEKVYSTPKLEKQKPPNISKKSYTEQLKEELKQIAPDVEEKLDITGYLGYVSDILKAKKNTDVHTLVSFDVGSSDLIRASNSSMIRASDSKLTLLAKKSSKSKDKQEKIKDKNEDVVDIIESSNKL